MFSGIRGQARHTLRWKKERARSPLQFATTAWESPTKLRDFVGDSHAVVGLGGMRQRIKELGGELLLRNTHPGTIVEVVIPIPLHAIEPASTADEMFSTKTQNKGC